MRAFFLFIILFIGNIMISAQTQITKSDVESVFAHGTSWVTSSSDSLQTTMDVGTASGSSQSWTIPNITWTQTFNASNVLPSSTPYASSFTSANVAQYSTGEIEGYQASFYQYYRLEDNSLYNLGSVIHVQDSGVDTTIYQMHEEMVFPLPLTYGTVIPVSRDSTEIMPGLYNIVTVTQTVDAFGTITFPFGTFDALRIKYVDQTEVYYNGSLINQYGSTSFTWITKNGGMFEADLDSSTNTSGSVTIYSASMTQFNAATSVEEKGNNISPTEFMLSQNYPNPFNPSTTISYQLAMGGYISLKVYDVIGNEVATLVNEQKSAGTYEVQFDGSKLSSGIYFYKLQAGNFVETRKMILLK